MLGMTPVQTQLALRVVVWAHLLYMVADYGNKKLGDN